MKTIIKQVLMTFYRM